MGQPYVQWSPPGPRLTPRRASSENASADAVMESTITWSTIRFSVCSTTPQELR